jgi:hypothetical protein
MVSAEQENKIANMFTKLSQTMFDFSDLFAIKDPLSLVPAKEGLLVCFI